VQGVCSHRGNR